MHGFTILDNLSRGPGKGGIRMTPSVTIDEVAKLARTMTWKNALAELPFGGAKSGLVANVKAISKAKKMQLIRAFAKALKPICPKYYVAAPDINTAEQEMKVFVETIGFLKAATGKPANLCVAPGEECGIPHEYGSTGFGVYHAAMIGCKYANLDPKKVKVAIEGFGNVGSFVFKYLNGKLKIVAVSDSKGVIYNKDGIDFKKLSKVKKDKRTVIKYKPGKILPSKSIIKLPVDILITAAIPNLITNKDVNKIKAKLIVEGSNIPTTAEVEEKLHKKGTLVVPDFVANAGGVISSYSEYIGSNPKDMFRLVERKIKKNTDLVLKRAKNKNIKPRDAALEIAIKRVKRKN